MFSRRDHRRMRPIRVVNVPFAIRLHRRVRVTFRSQCSRRNGRYSRRATQSKNASFHVRYKCILSDARPRSNHQLISKARAGWSPKPSRGKLSRVSAFRLLALILICAHSAVAAITIVPRNAATLWRVAEFGVTGAPAVSNPFDPDLISVKGAFTDPSGKLTTVEGFWFQNYNSTLSGGNESLATSGSPEWRIRFLPQ